MRATKTRTREADIFDFRVFVFSWLHLDTLVNRLGAILVAAVLSCSWAAFAQEKREFRVCADPENMPFSNRQMEGFENKIAEVMAQDLGAPVKYIWWGQRRGFIRNTMNATLQEGRCDVVIGVPKGYDLVR